VNRVSEFKYLCSTVQENGGSEHEIIRRIQCSWNSWKKVSGVLCDRKLPDKVKGKLHKTIVRPALLYGLETVPLTKVQMRKFDIAEMKMLRYEIAVSRIVKVRIENIRKRLEIETPCSSKIIENRLRWYGHVQRRDDEYIGKRAMGMEIVKRKRGRPKRRWFDCSREDLIAIGAHTDDALDNQKWKTMIRTGDPA
jgi:alpha-glucosidase (family GH31 glycosyl hydrolase)